jgi:hypothetical protein
VDVGDEAERAADNASTVVAGVGDKARRRSISRSTSLSGAGLAESAAASLSELAPDSGPQGPEAQDAYAAPEVRENDLAFADTRSDVYSLCTALHEVFTGADAEGKAARGILAAGMADDPSQRPAPGLIAEELAALARPHSAEVPPGALPPVRTNSMDSCTPP